MSKAKDKDSRPLVYLGMPSHGMPTAGALRGIYAYPSRKCRITVNEVSASLLGFAFNLLWSGAVQEWQKGDVSYFAMLHSDIDPEPYWVDTLLDELQAHEADVLSVTVPIKSAEGMTSTGIGHPSEEWAKVRRLSMQEVYALPETFGSEDLARVGAPAGSLLLGNTGCWLARLGPWCEGACFTVRDRMVKDEVGALRPEVIPEDWGFSRWCHGQGLKVMATRKVRVQHVGLFGYSNCHAWGELATEAESGPPVEVAG